MSIIARQSTARIVTVGPVLNADGVAVTDGVVADFKISKNGGAPAALDGSATLTHRHTGHYSLSLTVADLGTVGSAEITIDDTVNSCGIKEITVVEEAVYDALYAAAATGLLPANVTQWLGAAPATPNIAGIPRVDIEAVGGNDDVGLSGTVDAHVVSIEAAAITAASIASNALTAAKFAADVAESLLLRLENGTIDPAGTSVGGGVHTLELTGLTYPNDELINYRLLVTDISTGHRYLRPILSWTLAGNVATVEEMPFTVDTGDTWSLLAQSYYDDSTSVVGINAAAANKIADHARRRTQANVEASADGDALSLGSMYGLIQQGQESNATATPGSLTVYQTDGTTVLGTKTLSTNATADPVDGIS